jgi:flagellar biogenesis protein FliO
VSILRGLSVLLLALAAFASGVMAQSPEEPKPPAGDAVKAETVAGTEKTASSVTPSDQPDAPSMAGAETPGKPEAGSGDSAKDSPTPEGEKPEANTVPGGGPGAANDYRDRAFTLPTPEEAAAAPPSKDPAERDNWSGIRDVLIGLVLLSGVFIAVVWYLKRSPRTRKYFGAGPIKVLSRAHLGPRQTLYLVKAGERVLLIGQGGDGLNTLMEVSDPGEVSRTLALVEESAPESMTSTFRAALASASRRGDQPTTQHPAGTSARASASKRPESQSVDARIGDDPDVIRVDPSYSTQLKLAALRNQLDQPKAKVP